MPKEGESLMIKYNKGKRKTVCYSEGYKGTLRVAKRTSVLLTIDPKMLFLEKTSKLLKMIKS